MNTTTRNTLNDDQLDRRLHDIYQTMVPRLASHNADYVTVHLDDAFQLSDVSIVELTPTDFENQQRPRWSLTTVAMRVTAAAAAVLVVFGVAQLDSGTQSETPSAQPEPTQSSPPPAAPAVGETSPPISVNGNAASTVDVLLYPPVGTGATVTDAYMTPSIQDRWAATVVSPQGSAFGVFLSENFWGELPAGFQQRTVGDSIFAVGDEDGRTAYTTLQPCLMLSVSDDRASTDRTDTQIDTVLNGLAITNTNVVANVPDGWTSLGVGPIEDTYSISFDVTTAAGTRRAELRQMLDVNLGTLLSQARIPNIAPAAFDGTNAWIVVGPDPSVEFTYLAWQGDNGAVMLGLQDGTKAELIDLARNLETGHGTDWSGAIGEVTTATTATIAPSNRPTTSACPPKTLDVNR